MGGWNSPDIVVGPGQGHFLYILGLVIVAAYVPLYWWRKISDQRRGIADLGRACRWCSGRPVGSTSAACAGPDGGHAGGHADACPTMQAETEL